MLNETRQYRALSTPMLKLPRLKILCQNSPALPYYNCSMYMSSGLNANDYVYIYDKDSSDHDSCMYGADVVTTKKTKQYCLAV